jgi:hypothetical protein
VLQEAAALASRQGAVLIEAGVWVRLARLMAGRGRREAARKSVARLMARAEPADDAPVLRDLRAWLADV